MDRVTIHPAAEIFPMMEPDKLKELADDIVEYGLRFPVVRTRDGKILDGRNRLEACRIAGVEPRFETYAGGDPIGYVLSVNLNRRHLNPSQLAMVGEKVATLRRGDNQHTKEDAPRGASSKSQTEAAKEVGSSRRSVQRAAKVRERAEPSVAKAVEDGKLDLTTAEKLADAPAETQRAVASAPDPKAAAKSVITAPPPAVEESEWPEDAEGIPLPDRDDVRTAFINASHFDKALQLLKELTGEVNALIGDAGDKKTVHGGEWLADGRARVTESLKNLRERLRECRPHAVCPYCHGADEKCTGCRGHGWVVKDQWNRAPKEKRAALTPKSKAA